MVLVTSRMEYRYGWVKWSLTLKQNTDGECVFLLDLYVRASVPFNLERVNNCFFGKQPTVAGLERIGGLIMEKR